jgi:hypothetical protein
VRRLRLCGFPRVVRSEVVVPSILELVSISMHCACDGDDGPRRVLLVCVGLQGAQKRR